MPPRVLDGLEGLQAMVGQSLGQSDWFEVTQQRVNQFADGTGDDQWIHCDPERAKREMPDGKTIAHGYLTLSLLQALQSSIYEIRNVSRGINYGANKLRFVAPVQVGSRVRLVQTIKAVEPIDGGVRLVAESAFEIENQSKPALVIETVGLLFR